MVQLSVYARQRPGGVAWDAVPLTVRGLNKAVVNPPFTMSRHDWQRWQSTAHTAKGSQIEP